MTEYDQTPALRILHWNIHSWHDDEGMSNLDRVAELVRVTDPDVVSLVEVDETWSKPSTLDELAARCGQTSVFVPSLEFGQDESTGGFGNAILTNLPILAVRYRQLVWPVPIYDGSEPSEPRSVVFLKVETHNGPVWVGSTHLPRSDENARTVALRQLVSISGGLDAPWLLVGDFNLPPTGWIGKYTRLRAYPSPARATYPTAKPIEAIDYCVAPERLRVEAEVVRAVGSDHLPLVVRGWAEH